MQWITEITETLVDSYGEGKAINILILFSHQIKKVLN